MTPRPSSVRLRAYQVGFGDCFLLTVGYGSPLPDGRTEGHLLVDFGSRGTRRGQPTLGRVAELIRADCGGTLDAVVATHRHQDHVSGFGTAAALEALDGVRPGLVVRPWTDAPADAIDHSTGVGTPLHGPDSREFVGLLDRMAEQSSAVAEIFAVDRTDDGSRARELSELGIPNAAALATLDDWGGEDRTRWVKAGDEVDVGLPGVRVRVLGPPTLEQVPGLQHYASSSAEYWLGLTRDSRIQPLVERAGDPAATDRLVAAPDGFGAPAWLLDRLRKASTGQVLAIVDGFDEVLNNTSVVLLVTVGRRTLLLAGDAQVENWSWALDRALAPTKPDTELRRALAGVELYKVGHHGSRNATPKRLYDLWTQAPQPRPLVSVMSTCGGLYGKTPTTAVPQDKLVTALRAAGSLYSTEHLPERSAWFDVEADARPRDATYTYAAGPPLT